MDELSKWLLVGDERGNTATKVGRTTEHPPWTTGNEVRVLVHGAEYFARLAECSRELRSGDQVFLTDWRGDDDEFLSDDGPRLGELLVDLEHRGVDVRGLLWRSHPRFMGYSEETQSELAAMVNEAGGEILLDERVRRAGSHHQKLVLLHRPADPDRDVAFVGGIDLCHGRRDDERHLGDPQTQEIDKTYGPRAPWHDVQAEVRGPAVAGLAETFRERWEDPTPLEHKSSPRGRLRVRATREPTRPAPLPPFGRAPAPAGRHTVQIVRTYPAKRPAYPFAPEGERTIAQLYRKAFARARSLIYVEDQYFWSNEVASMFVQALRRAPSLRVVVVVPRTPDRNGAVTGPPHRVGQHELFDRVTAAGGERVAVFDLENDHGTPIYVHAKVVVIDDVLALVGSDNMNRRSWTHDSELSISVLDDERDDREPLDPGGDGDGARRFARDLRLRLWREHLGVDGDEGLVDPGAGFDRLRAAADTLDAWHRDGRRGPRPQGHLRWHRVQPVTTWQRVWAWPMYQTLVDPDGRTLALRQRHRY